MLGKRATALNDLPGGIVGPCGADDADGIDPEMHEETPILRRKQSIDEMIGYLVEADRCVDATAPPRERAALRSLLSGSVVGTRERAWSREVSIRPYNRILRASSTAKLRSANRLEVRASASAPISSDALETRMERNRISMPAVVPMNPIGGRMLACMEIGRA